MTHLTGDLLLKLSTSCGGRRTHHKQEKPAARNCAASNFLVLFSLLFEHALKASL